MSWVVDAMVILATMTSVDRRFGRYSPPMKAGWTRPNEAPSASLNAEVAKKSGISSSRQQSISSFRAALRSAPLMRASSWVSRPRGQMSVMQWAKLNGHDPWAYLKDVLTLLQTHMNSRIDELLPHRWQPMD